MNVMGGNLFSGPDDLDALLDELEEEEAPELKGEGRYFKPSPTDVGLPTIPSGPPKPSSGYRTRNRSPRRCIRRYHV